jgi:integrase
MSPRTERLDRVFAGVGRIARASGTTDAKTFRRINAMLSGLHNIGKLDVLAWIRDGHHSPLEVLHHWERGMIDRLASPEAAADLVSALDEYAKNLQCSASYRANLGTSIRRVKAKAKQGTQVQTLPAILRDAKKAMQETPIAFNRFRSQMLTFVSEIHGKHSPLWVEVSRVNRFTKVEGRRPKTLQRRPLTVAELDAVCAAFVDVPVYGGRKGAANKGNKALRRTIQAGALAEMAYNLAYTGMRPQEFWMRRGAAWTLRDSAVVINGTKTPAAKRVTPYIEAVWAPVCGEQFYREQFAAATTKALREGLDLYSLRRTFAKLCEDAGIVESRRAAYMGHGPRTITDLYLKTNVLPFVQQDAATVSSWLKAERERAAARPTLKLESNA